MVLQKIGSTVTEILVNGVTEYGPSEQKYDTTYDLDVTESITSTTTISHSCNSSISDGGSSSNTYFDVPPDAVRANSDMDYSITGDGDGAIKIYVNGNEKDEVYDVNETHSGTLTVSEGDDIEIYMYAAGSVANSANMDGSISFTVANGIGTTTNSVTKS